MTNENSEPGEWVSGGLANESGSRMQTLILLIIDYDKFQVIFSKLLIT